MAITFVEIRAGVVTARETTTQTVSGTVEIPMRINCEELLMNLSRLVSPALRDTYQTGYVFCLKNVRDIFPWTCVPMPKTVIILSAKVVADSGDETEQSTVRMELGRALDTTSVLADCERVLSGILLRETGVSIMTREYYARQEEKWGKR